MHGHVPPVHRRRGGRVPDRRSRDLGAALARHRAAGLRCADARRADQAGDAPVDRRGRHQDLRRRQRASRRDLPHPPRAGRCSRTGRAGRRGRRHASVLGLEGSGPLPGRPLREHRRGAAAAGAFAADLRPARPRRRARSDDDDRSDEHGAVLPAAPAGAVDQLAVLDGTRHRAEVVSHHRLPAVPAHRRSRSFRLVERLRELRADCSSSCTASTTRRRSGGTCGRTRHSARSSSASAT